MDKIIHSCLICGGTDLITLEKYAKDYLVKCQGCSLVFSKVDPTPEELNKIYSCYRRGTNTPTDITKKKYQSRAKYLSELTPIKSVLDVGCGDGDFLECFFDLGAKTYGTEFDEGSGLVAKKKGALMLSNGLTPDLPEGVDGFDAILFTEVIEHINRPIVVLEHLYELLKPGGIVFITTPNWSSVERWILGPGWGMIAYPEHLCYYTPETIDHVMRKVGFKKISTYTENVSIFRIMQFLNAKTKRNNRDPEKISSAAQRFGNKNTIGLVIKRTLNSILSLTGTGSSLIAVYRKSL